jgi:hypothetical protein
MWQVLMANFPGKSIKFALDATLADFLLYADLRDSSRFSWIKAKNVLVEGCLNREGAKNTKN